MQNSMRIRWRGLELPSQVVTDKSVSSDTFGRFEVEPFEHGLGTTVGNSLRRILLSSLEGAAITQIKVENASHEFTPIEHVMEDMTEIVLNVKELIVRSDSYEPRLVKIDVQGPQAGGKAVKVTAADIQTDSSVQVVNRDRLICTLTGPVRFQMELTIRKGRGFVPATETFNKDEQVIGVIPIDANYSPISRVRYHVEDTRVGQRTNYEKLVIEVWTKGTVTPEMALVESAKIMRKHLNPFVQYYDLGEEVAADVQPAATPVDDALLRKLDMGIHELELSVRATNCLESAKLLKVRDVVQKTEADLLAVRSFGKTSLREVKRKLVDIGLQLGMILPPEAAGSPAPAPTEDDE